tara:strand:- start:272 stop:658 length:387 start_codon:yes stop_codon:yes gene_type:complete
MAFTISCGFEAEESNDSPKFWKGSESGFEENFDYYNEVDDSSKPILLEKVTGNPYSGTLELNGSGQVTTKTFQDGILEGISVKRSKDGSWVEAHYVKGQLHGKMTFFDANGKIRTVMSYEKGKLKTSD